MESDERKRAEGRALADGDPPPPDGDWRRDERGAPVQGDLPGSPFAGFHEGAESGPTAPDGGDTEGAPGPSPGAEPEAALEPAPASGRAGEPRPLPVPAAAREAAISPLTAWARGVGRLAMAGISMGLAFGVWSLRGDFGAFLRENRIGTKARLFILMSMLGGAVVMVLVPSVILLLSGWRARRRTGVAERWAPRWARLDPIGRRLAPLALAGFLPMLFQWRVWSGQDVTFLVLMLLLALAADRTFRVALLAPPLLGRRLGGGGGSLSLLDRVGVLLMRVQAALARLASRLSRTTVVLVLLGVAGYAAFFSFVTIRYHRNLHTTSFDLGLEENLLWNIIHGFHFFKSTPFSGPGGAHFGNHATFISYLLAPIYAIYQHGETMLVIQAVLMGAAAIPLYFFARRHLGPWPACLIAFVYLLYPPLHGAALYDFHYLPLGPVFLWSCLYFTERRRNRLAILFAVLTLSVREDVAAGLGIVGAYLLISGERPRAGLLLAIIGTTTFVALKLVIMPQFAGGSSFVYMYTGLLPAGESNFGGVLKTVASNPAFTLGSLLERDKLVYVLQLFVPLAFMPMRRPLGLLFVSAGFFFTLLSTGYAPLIQTSFQYTTHWTSYLFIGLVVTLAGLRRHADRAVGRAQYLAALAGMAFAFLPVSYQYGAVLQQNTVRGGFGVYDFQTDPDERRQRRELYELIALLPPRASVASSENIVPQIANRSDSYTLRTGNHDAEYLLFTIPIRGDERPYVYEPIRDQRYGVVAHRSSFGLAKRGHSTALNMAVLGRM